MKSLEVNYVWNCQAYSDNMNETSRKIPTDMPVKTSQHFKGMRKLLLTEIGGKWYMNKMNTKLLP